MADLSVKFKNLTFKNPIIMASGTFGFGREYNEVYDISQTNAIKKKKEYKKEYVDVILKGMCERRNLYYDPNNQMENIESIVSDISNNTRSSNASYFDVDRYASQSQAEVIATMLNAKVYLDIAEEK